MADPSDAPWGDPPSRWNHYTKHRNVLGVATEQEMKSDTEHRALLDALLAERDLRQYGLFAVTGEGTVTPDGYEETSGYALSRDGYAFFFWTGWDKAAG